MRPTAALKELTDELQCEVAARKKDEKTRQTQAQEYEEKQKAHQQLKDERSKQLIDLSSAVDSAVKSHEYEEAMKKQTQYRALQKTPLLAPSEHVVNAKGCCASCCFFVSCASCFVFRVSCLR